MQEKNKDNFPCPHPERRGRRSNNGFCVSFYCIRLRPPGTNLGYRRGRSKCNSLLGFVKSYTTYFAVKGEFMHT